MEYTGRRCLGDCGSLGRPCGRACVRNAQEWGDFLSRRVDGRRVRLVRPGDTERPTWAVYERGGHLGTVHARPDGDGVWHVQEVGEQCDNLDDAIRMLRRPPVWLRQRQQVGRWAHALLADPSMLILDVQIAGLGTEAWAVQIAALNSQGRALVNELLNPCRPIAAEASRLHGITDAHVARAPCFGDLLPELRSVVTGRRCVAYNARFDKGVLDRELERFQGSALPGRASLRPRCWEDALGPASVARGMWLADRALYRRHRPGGGYDATEKCRGLLRRLHELARAA
ncbi:3'-5' exonuclease [Streptomyces zaomyceticus]|uniref:3'-5' exonuclease n=1 Tax=Streptomyces zaomyceticus TaxID=68286 RepID=UPI0036AAA4D5